MWLATHQDGFQNCAKVYLEAEHVYNKNTLTAVLSPACLEIRSRNEQAIN